MAPARCRDRDNTITQNSAGTIAFETGGGYIHVFVENPDYDVDF